MRVTLSDAHYAATTETDDLAQALDEAAARWPGLSRAQTLVQLALEGHRAAQEGREEQRRRRLAAVHRHSAMLTGAYDTRSASRTKSSPSKSVE